jgi:SAM-dependent methyltransferase
VSPPSSAPTERFSDRVEDYVRYRPGYPRALLDYLREHARLDASSVVADVGSGTGISTALFLDAGCEVFAVEPNAAMRAAAELRLRQNASFYSVDGRAEQTTLADASVDIVAAGTAFHWFEPSATRAEFARILRPRGHVTLFWNMRSHAPDFMPDFMHRYEALLDEFCADYSTANAARRSDAASIQAFFGSNPVDKASFANAQRLDFEGLLGRVLSSSYAPKPGNPAHAPMCAALRSLFDSQEVAGHVTLTYETRLYLGRMN